MSKSEGPFGGHNGVEFDDGFNDGVRKVCVGEESHAVVYIKIEYVKDGMVVEQEHGKNTGTQTETNFEVNYPDEYITGISGTLKRDRDDYISKLVSELQFKTSYGRKSQLFGTTGSNSIKYNLGGIGTNLLKTESKFALGENGTKLLGLHGRSGHFLNAIGAHFVLVSSAFKQVLPFSRLGGVSISWNDGVYDGVKKVCVGEDGDRVSYVEFGYGKGDQSITLSHGMKPQERKEFLLDYTHDEYIKSVEGTYDENGFVSSLTFVTSMARKSEEIGKAGCTKFVIKAKGFDKLVGFQGKSSVDCFHALGANFAVVLAPPVTKLKAEGSDYGDEWDDGIHDSIRQIIVRYNGPLMESVKFEYVNGYDNGMYQTVEGDNHGYIHKDQKEKGFLFVDEYITSVEGLYGQKSPVDGPIHPFDEIGENYITMLKFTTNNGTYEVLESDTPGYMYVGTPFVLKEEGHKIVGFYGKSSYSRLEQIGVYVKPIDDA